MNFEHKEILDYQKGRQLTKRIQFNDEEIRTAAAQMLHDHKRKTLTEVGAGTVIKDWEHLPETFIRINNLNQLEKLLKHPKVERVYIPPALHATSLLPTTQPALAFVGQQNTYRGAGTRVAVIDTGVDYSSADFSTDLSVSLPCYDPSVASSLLYPSQDALGTGHCRISHMLDFTGQNIFPYVAGTNYPPGYIVSNAGNYYACTGPYCATPGTEPGVGPNWGSTWSVVPNPNTIVLPGNDADLIGHHGTIVAGAIAEVAPRTMIDSLRVYTRDTNNRRVANSVAALDAINWVIHNAGIAPRIVAVNLSFSVGFGPVNAQCPSSIFAGDMAVLIANGIIPVAASGNEKNKQQIGDPACVPGVVSVGAVYTANEGTQSWNPCTDSSTYADLVTCFSNSSSILTLLAPGDNVWGGGYSAGGTSVAAPIVSGAVAILRSSNGWPNDSNDDTIKKMTATGVSVKDPANGVTTPRLNLTSATAAPPAGICPGASTSGATTVCPLSSPSSYPLTVTQCTGDSLSQTCIAVPNPALGAINDLSMLIMMH